ncbi:hypothetical protein N2599_29690 (plasmid) [Rhizobium sullae]|uniref:Uncharacterized protein n=1 Tax=Rhizobium sullae TaxID=50338 RepID=A0ABY5XQS8_RHISU|nr:hypothetical protein [Rhizobium sullae]UWU16980.1 hypothetical protein N2599_29690 [Rhizobium sullae]
MVDVQSVNADSSEYYIYPLEDDEIDAVTGAGSWVGHVDRGLIGGGYAAGGTYATTGSIGKAGIAGGVGFAAGATGSIYNGGLSGGGNSSGRVICTHFFRRGMLDRDLWRADLEFTYQALSQTTVRGYQYWAIPYVRLMRRSPLAEKIMYPLAKARAEEIAYQAGRRSRGSLGGKLVRLIGEPLCFLIGSVVKQKDWAPLWAEGRQSSGGQ